MITKFKIYENNSDCNLYWKVRTKQPYFDISCWKIGVPEGRFEFMNDPIITKERKIGKYILIQKF